MRFLGDTRFVVQALKELASFKHYKAKLSILPCPKDIFDPKVKVAETCKPVCGECNTCDPSQQYDEIFFYLGGFDLNGIHRVGPFFFF